MKIHHQYTSMYSKFENCQKSKNKIHKTPKNLKCQHTDNPWNKENINHYVRYTDHVNMNQSYIKLTTNK